MIRVTIPKDVAYRWPNEIPNNMKVLERLREAGIPVIGHMSVRGAEGGKLTIQNVDGNIVYTYEEEEL